MIYLRNLQNFEIYPKEIFCKLRLFHQNNKYTIISGFLFYLTFKKNQGKLAYIF